MVSVEAAFAIAAIAAFLVLGVGAVGAVIAQIRCTDAAREVARLAAAGDPKASAAGAAVAPGGARIEVREVGDTVEVRVTARARLLPLLTVSAGAVAAREPDEASGVDGGDGAEE